jgi:hypothetical protein
MLQQSWYISFRPPRFDSTWYFSTPGDPHKKQRRFSRTENQGKREGRQKSCKEVIGKIGESSEAKREQESKAAETTGGKAKKTTEKREEEAFIAGRTGTLHYSLQSKGGK